MNDFFSQIVIVLGSIGAFDDAVTGVASLALCVCSAALFAVVFAGAI